jgi:uncharacterized protein YdcH (DUF465 family)
MEQREQQAIRSLLDQDFELRKTFRQHADLEKQIESFNGRPALTAADEALRKKLQKRKLAGMDRMMAIVARHDTESGVPKMS